MVGEGCNKQMSEKRGERITGVQILGTSVWIREKYKGEEKEGGMGGERGAARLRKTGTNRKAHCPERQT